MSVKINYVELGNRIKKYRQKEHLTQEQLADKIDMVTSNISHIERATTQVSLPSLVKIANVLNVSLDQLVCDSLSVCSTTYLEKDIADLLAVCSPEEKQIVKDIVAATVKTLKEHR